MMNAFLKFTSQNYLLILGLATLFAIANLDAQTEEPFFKNGTYEPGVPSPDEVLGFPLGQRPARHGEILRYFKALAEKSPRVQLLEKGKTHEGRELIYAIISLSLIHI